MSFGLSNSLKEHAPNTFQPIAIALATPPLLLGLAAACRSMNSLLAVPYRNQESESVLPTRVVECREQVPSGTSMREQQKHLSGRSPRSLQLAVSNANRSRQHCPDDPALDAAGY